MLTVAFVTCHSALRESQPDYAAATRRSRVWYMPHPPHCTDGGPWACVEDGCETTTVDCRTLARALSCKKWFGELWTTLPSPDLGERRVRDVCRMSCGECSSNSTTSSVPEVRLASGHSMPMIAIDLSHFDPAADTAFSRRLLQASRNRHRLALDVSSASYDGAQPVRLARLGSFLRRLPRASYYLSVSIDPSRADKRSYSHCEASTDDSPTRVCHDVAKGAIDQVCQLMRHAGSMPFSCV